MGLCIEKLTCERLLWSLDLNISWIERFSLKKIHNQRQRMIRLISPWAWRKSTTIYSQVVVALYFFELVHLFLSSLLIIERPQINTSAAVDMVIEASLHPLLMQARYARQFKSMTYRCVSERKKAETPFLCLSFYRNIHIAR